MPTTTTVTTDNREKRADHVPVDLYRVAGVRQVQVDPRRDQEEPGKQSERPPAARCRQRASRRRDHRDGQHHARTDGVERPERAPRDPLADVEQVVRAELVTQRPSEVIAQPVEPERRLEHERFGSRDPAAAVSPGAVVGQRRIAEERLAVGPRVTADPRHQRLVDRHPA